MDKFEYELKIEQIEKLISREDYSTAKKIADSMEWKKEKDPKLLSHVAELYAQAGDIDKALKLYNYAYKASSRGLLVLERMTELAIIYGQLDLAEELCEEYRAAGAYDPDYYMFKYQIAEGRGEDYVKRIPFLEKYCESELDEEAMYQLAWLYDRAGMDDKCVKTCDFIIDYFCFGESVDHAIALKLNHAKLTEYQERRVTNAEGYKKSYEEYLKAQDENEKREKSERQHEEQIREDALMEQQENDLGRQVSEIVEENERKKKEVNLEELVAEEEAMAMISFPSATSTVPEETRDEEEEPEAEPEPAAEGATEIEAEPETEIENQEEQEPEEEEPEEKEPEVETEEKIEEPMTEIEGEPEAEELEAEAEEEPEVEEPEVETEEEPEPELELEEELESEEEDEPELKPESVEESEPGAIDVLVDGVEEILAEEKPVENNPDEILDVLMKEIQAAEEVTEPLKEVEEAAADLMALDDVAEEIEGLEENDETEKADSEEKEESVEEQLEESIEEQLEEQPSIEEPSEHLEEPVEESAEEAGEEAGDLSIEEAIAKTTEELVQEAMSSEVETYAPQIDVAKPRRRLKHTSDSSVLDVVIPEGSFCVSCTDIEMGVKYAVELVRLVPTDERCEHVARVPANRVNKGKFSSIEQQLDRDILLITNASKLTNTALDNLYAWMKKSMENKAIFVDDAEGLEELGKRRPKLMKRFSEIYVYEKRNTEEWMELVDSYVDENNCVLADDAYHLFEEYLQDKEEKGDVVLGITLKDAVQDALYMASRISVRNMISSIADTKYDDEGLLILRDRHFL